MRNIKLLFCCLRQLFRHHQLSFACRLPPRLHLLGHPCALRVPRDTRASAMARLTGQRGASFSYHRDRSHCARDSSGPIPMASARTLSSALMRHSSRFRRHRTARCERARSHVTVPWTQISSRPSFPSRKPGATSIRSSLMVPLRSSKSPGRDRAEKLDQVQLHTGSRETLYTALFHPLHVFAFQLSLRCLVDILCRDLVPL